MEGNRRETLNTVWTPGSLFSTIGIAASVCLSYMRLFPDVQSYLSWLLSDEAKTVRPAPCSACGGQVWHRHGTYSRTVYTVVEFFLIPVARFLCTLCQATASLLPSFIGRHQPFTWDVQQQVVVAREQGQTTEQAALSVPPPGGPLSAATVVRWCARWRRRLSLWEAMFWQQMLAWKPSLSLLSAFVSTLIRLLGAWEQTADCHLAIGLFHGLLGLCQPQANIPIPQAIPHNLALVESAGPPP